MRQRIVWIDELKAFAIILVVMGHVLISRFLPQFTVWHDVIYSFHMPLFMFLSGLFAYKATEAVERGMKKKYMENKFRQLLLPVIFGGGILCLFHHENYITQYLLRGGAYYWYLVTLFEFLLIFLIARFISRKYFYLLVTIPYLAVLFAPSSSILAEMVSKDNFMFTYPYFVYGHIFNKYRMQRKIAIKNVEFVFCLLLLVALVVLTTFTHLKCLNYGIAFFVINILIFLFDRFFSKLKVLEFFGNYLGKETLSIYILHYFFLGLTPFGIMEQYNGSNTSVIQYSFIVIAVSCLIILISLSMSALLQKSKYISMLLLGKMS